ncbi:short-chain dehydrogenase [Burkholderia diffusa]|uniref:Short-chain dehydrogenase n=1 Tax=Burkholderia diffusa TaxID=488732 RepID=A0AAW3PA54_9BURK|nr:SDR family oxidoreductase [Burkholderia diffusa]KWF32806.1 short-chain dehydrogenase [Burkholderia diffusa]KWF38730.1 short-chain dehydrogenase [Burkholderia diffusa]KWF46775.1 short-chain dehydrogenase [Burkholderia diffusa]KWF50655.1 short-chain dehydrogenase [Burkholderia diffusa]
MSRLHEKVAFVTGAGGGIGRAICRRFVAEGALIAAVDIDVDLARTAIDGFGPAARAIAVQCDVGDGESVRRAIGETVATFGQLNVLCNVAGGSTPRDGSVTDTSDTEFWRAIRLDLYGTFACCKHGLPELIKAGGGAVINMTSMVALMGIADKACYTAAKGGVISLTRSMAVDYARHNIRVNAIAPGITLTPRVAARLESSETLQQLTSRHLLGAAVPDDIAHLAVYLACDESRVVTGQVFPVDSGATIS